MAELLEEFKIANLESLKAIAHPLRLQLLERLKRAKTVKELAAMLDMPATKLYYHVNLLEEKGFIQVVDTQIVSGIIEKRYQAVARQFHIDDNMLATNEDEGQVGALLRSFFTTAQREFEQSIRAGLVDLKDKGQPHKGSLLRAKFHLSEDQARAFYGRFDDLVQEYSTLSRDNEVDPQIQQYALTLAYFPIYSPDES
ncbi:MAG TPA: helix-turn-helix domain-containing protein [Chloroflexota bacterium]|nr:helix-turn-helix domain-containing protein [Chloroflexota bacterium]HUM70530.1 helix-turn-helix domain-containing protein [Chloroflexota bacterium]